MGEKIHYLLTLKPILVYFNRIQRTDSETGYLSLRFMCTKIYLILRFIYTKIYLTEVKVLYENTRTVSVYGSFGKSIDTLDV